ncbi:MAG: hypothetical protein AAF902_10660 [Chloroflexota bacterium]
MTSKKNEQAGVSNEILAAQEKLLQLRKKARQDRIERGLPVDINKTEAGQRVLKALVLDGDTSKLSIMDRLAQLPSHLGWGGISAERRQKLVQKQGLSCSHLNSVENPKEFSPAPDCAQPPTNLKREHTTPICEPDPIVPIFAHVLDAIHRHKSDGAGRIWLLLRYIDKQKGEGRVKVRDARYQICDPVGRLKCLSKKRFQQLVRSGEGRFWHKSKDGRYLYYHSEARVAAALGLSDIRGLAVDVPVEDLLKPIRHVRALFYEAFHCGRGEGFNNPITRRVMQDRGMTDGRTQRQYEALRGIEKRSEFAVVSKYSKEAWNRAQFEDDDERLGGPAFVYIDYKGILGKNPDRIKRPKGRRHWHHIYIMRQIGNAYAGNLNSTKRGRGWTSHKLRHLCHYMPTLTGSAGSNGHPVIDEPPKVEKMYYENPKEVTRFLRSESRRTEGGYSSRPLYSPGYRDMEWKEDGLGPTKISKSSFYWEERFLLF